MYQDTRRLDFHALGREIKRKREAKGWTQEYLAQLVLAYLSYPWARQKDENWVNKDITSLEFVENIFRLMNWNRECRYKVLGRVANSDQGLCRQTDFSMLRSAVGFRFS